MAKSRLDILQENAKLKNKLLLIEHCTYTFTPSKVELFEKVQMIESASGQKWKCRGILRNVPVTRYIKNLNGRTYLRELWERVKGLGWFEGGLCLADHADDSGSVRNICGIWRNFQVGSEYATADLYCVTDDGQDLLEIAQAGGPCGFSTCGYGEYIPGTDHVVNPKTFEMDPALSVCDWVLGPSQQVFGTLEHVDKESVKEQVNLVEASLQPAIHPEGVTTEIPETATMGEAVEEIPDVIETPPQNVEGEITSEIEPLKDDVARFTPVSDENTNKLELSQEEPEDTQGIIPTIMETKEMTDINKEVSTIGKLFESNLRNQARNAIREAVESKDPVRAAKDLQEFATTIPETMADTHVKIKETIESINEKFGVQFQEKDQKLSQMNETIASVNAKYATLENTHKELVEKYTQAAVILNKFKEASSAKTLLEENVKIMESDLKQLQEDADVMQKDIDQMAGDRKVMEADMDQFETDRAIMEQDIDQMAKDKEVMQGDIDRLVTESKLKEEELEKVKAEDEMLKTENTKLTEKVQKQKTLIEKFVKAQTKTKRMFENYGMKIDEEMVVDENDVEAVKDILPEDIQAATIPAAEAPGTFGPIVDKIPEQAQTQKINESRANAIVDASVKQYFEAELKNFPSLHNFKEEILSAKSIVEAVKLVENAKKKDGDKLISIKEIADKQRPSWLNNRF